MIPEALYILKRLHLQKKNAPDYKQMYSTSGLVEKCYRKAPDSPPPSPQRNKQRQAAADEGHAVSLPLLHKPRR